MRFVIWGAGARGRRLLHFLGKDRVAAYIDRKTSLQGTLLDGVPVMSLIDFLKSSLLDTTWVINTPLFLQDTVQKQLNESGITKYLSLKDCPDEFYDYQYDDIIQPIVNYTSGKDMYYLYGFNLYSLLIGESLTAMGKKITLVMDDNEFTSDSKRISNINFLQIQPLSMIKSNTKLLWTARNDYNEIEKLKNNGFDIINCSNFDILKNPYFNESLIQFKDKYKGQRCFIVATGPSLQIDDLEKLHAHNEFCIGLNGIYHSFTKTIWRPNVFVMTDPSLIDLKDIIENMNVDIKFISDNNMDYWKECHKKNIHRVHLRYSENKQKYSSDITKGLYSSCNVTYCCLQLATYMGFKSIYLLGVDFNNIANSHFVNQKKYRCNISSTRSNDIHYSSQELQNFQLKGYIKAEEYTQKNNIKIYNATRGGSLDIFERCSFDELF